MCYDISISRAGCHSTAPALVLAFVSLACRLKDVKRRTAMSEEERQELIRKIIEHFRRLGLISDD